MCIFHILYIYIYNYTHVVLYGNIHIYIYMFVCICIYIYMCIPIYLHTSCQGHITIFTPHLNEGTQSLFHTCWRNPHTHKFFMKQHHLRRGPTTSSFWGRHAYMTTHIYYIHIRTHTHTYIYIILYIYIYNIIYIYMHLRMSMMIWAFQPQLYPHLKLHCPGLWRRQWGGERWEA